MPREPRPRPKPRISKARQHEFFLMLLATVGPLYRTVAKGGATSVEVRIRDLSAEHFTLSERESLTREIEVATNFNSEYVLLPRYAAWCRAMRRRGRQA